MKIAYFDCFSGIAGDMALASLLDAGAPLEELVAALQSLPVEGWNIESEAVLRSGIHAQSVSIFLHGQTDDEELQAVNAHKAAHEPRHHHEHGDHDHHHHDEESHDHNHSPAPHDHAHEHHHDHPHHHGRSMRAIRDIIEASDLSARVKRDSLAIFGKIAVAEAFLHHSTPDEVHFHEIGGLDSLLDIVGVAWCLERLGIDAVYASALPMSGGFVDCAHGRMPVPAPATLEMLKGVPWTPTDVRGELVTPTGAGILAALCKGYGTAPAMTLETIGLGAGKKQLPDRPNILRVSIGESSAETSIDGLEWKTLSQFEANVDDLNPQAWELAFERLFEAGALDVWLVPIHMKKGRPALLLGVLCEQSQENAVLSAILLETTTLGVRRTRLERAALSREMASVETVFGSIGVKIAHNSALHLWRAQPEWDDVKRAAKSAGVPAREVHEAALQAASALQTGN
ncbi:pyridinium-3,5-bisthiocarboxylic acid mononucleotide nickel insertion protein [Abditibacteriota bacterium]|nr:pyridinium-3,5-bisthiocarboxylic acid mononucleotide nickel insertion protein [Abditibacteriota bacterium]